MARADILKEGRGVKFHIPIRLPSLSNMSHAHWRRLTGIKKEQRAATLRALKECSKDLPPAPITVKITRVGVRKLDDDNLQGACKYVRDEIAKAYGIDDASSLYTWQYGQRIGEYGVEVEITKRGES